MVITTTNNIENRVVKEYINVVCSNIVIGANIFSDIAASFTDFFGGRSESYQSKLKLIYDEVTRDLIDKASSLGANAILGFHVDFDEVSGGGKSMFMVSASGTAVKIGSVNSDRYEVYRKLNEIHEYLSKGFMSQTEYEFEKENIIKLYKNTIPEESELSIQQRTIDNTRIIEQERKQAERDKFIEEARKSIQERSEKPYTEESISVLTEIEIQSTNYDSIPIVNEGNMEVVIAKLIRLNKVPEACKYYIDETGLNYQDAISYVLDTYQRIELVDKERFDKLVIKLQVLKKKGFIDQAIKEYMNYSFADEEQSIFFIKQL